MSTMQNIAAHGTSRQAQRENYGMMRQVPGLAGGDIRRTQCQFPEAPPHRCYCNPAAFHSVDGANYHRLLVAYGASRPCN